ncbi:MAG: radical SAM protein [Candidatus Eremiobacteraeota bacterium]|nr:radical SAM protein [Candidatus Eremiobacteraeota bacterium]
MIKRIALVEPDTDIPNIYKLIGIPRLGLPVLGNLLEHEGYEVDIFSDKIRKPSMGELEGYDLLGISILTNSSHQGYRYADALKKRGKTVIMGGPHATFQPDEALGHCDYVARGEAEKTFLELLAALNAGSGVEGIKGLSYRKDGAIVHNEDREISDEFINVPATFSRVKGIEAYKNGLGSRFFYTPMVYTSRGCPFNCRYCTVIKLAGRKLRYRDLDCCIDDIRNALKGIKERKSIMIIDDNFTVDMDRAKELLRKMIRLGKPRHVLYNMQLRVETFKDEEFLSLINEAGFGLLHVGFESISRGSLKEWKKNISVEQIRFAVEQARKHGLKVNGMFIVGSDSDTEETVAETVDHAIELGMAVMQLFILCPLPGSEVFTQCVEENRIFTYDWRYYDCHHSVFFPMHMRPSVLQRAVQRANKKFYSFKRMFLERTYGNRITCGLALRQAEKYHRDYIRKLEAFEEPFYGNNGTLLKEKLGENRPEERLL